MKGSLGLITDSQTFLINRKSYEFWKSIKMKEKEEKKLKKAAVLLLAKILHSSWAKKTLQGDDRSRNCNNKEHNFGEKVATQNRLSCFCGVGWGYS